MAMNREQRRMMQRQGSLDAEGNPTSSARAKKRAAPQAPKTKSDEPRPGPIKWLRRYIREVIAEFRKVVFPTKEEVRKYSIVVLIFLVVMISIIGALDYGLSNLVLKVFT